MGENVTEPVEQERSVAYRTVAADLREALASGEFADGRALPTESALCDQYGVSRQTIRHAMQQLVGEGLVFRVRGRGTFATSEGEKPQYLRTVGSIEDVLALAEDTEIEVLEQLGRKVDIAAASRLQLRTDDIVTGMFRRLHRDLPFSVSEIFIPVEIGQKIIDSGRVPPTGVKDKITLTELIDELAPEPIGGAQQSISATIASSEVAGWIDLEVGCPALRIDRLYVDSSGRPLALTINFFNPDRYSYRLDLERSN